MKELTDGKSLKGRDISNDRDAIDKRIKALKQYGEGLGDIKKDRFLTRLTALENKYKTTSEAAHIRETVTKEADRVIDSLSRKMDEVLGKSKEENEKVEQAEEPIAENVPVYAGESADGKWVEFKLDGDFSDDTRRLWVDRSDTLEKWSKSIADAYDVEESSLKVYDSVDYVLMMPEGKFADFYDKKDVDNNDVYFIVFGYAGNELQRDFQAALVERCGFEIQDVSPDVADFMLKEACDDDRKLIEGAYAVSGDRGARPWIAAVVAMAVDKHLYMREWEEKDAPDYMKFRREQLRQVIKHAFHLRTLAFRHASMYICPAQCELHGTPVQS